jgi:hypothetical protein
VGVLEEDADEFACGVACAADDACSDVHGCIVLNVSAMRW